MGFLRDSSGYDGQIVRGPRPSDWGKGRQSARPTLTIGPPFSGDIEAPSLG
jgi:hypothetical protein